MKCVREDAAALAPDKQLDVSKLGMVGHQSHLTCLLTQRIVSYISLFKVNLHFHMNFMNDKAVVSCALSAF